MTTDTSADGQVGFDGKALARVLAGLVILGAGLWATARIAYWYGADNVFVGGAHLRDPSAARLPAFVAVTVTVLGIGVLVARRRFTAAAGIALLTVLTVGSILAAWLAIAGYPAIQRAKVVAIDPDTRYIQWTASVPLTSVIGVSDDSDGRVTVTGSFIDHGCVDTFRGVTLDRRTGEVLDAFDLPGSYSYATEPVAGADTLESHGLVSERGELPFVCLN